MLVKGHTLMNSLLSKYSLSSSYEYPDPAIESTSSKQKTPAPSVIFCREVGFQSGSIEDKLKSNRPVHTDQH